MKSILCMDEMIIYLICIGDFTA